MTDKRPLILLTNDDGIHAEGLRKLRTAAAKLGQVRIVAPESEQSAVGHSITLYDPIKAHEVTKDGKFYGYGIGGTPADSVKLAVYSLLAPAARSGNLRNQQWLQSGNKCSIFRDGFGSHRGSHTWFSFNGGFIGTEERPALRMGRAPH